MGLYGTVPYTISPKSQTVRYSFVVDRRSRYLDAALALFIEHGFTGMSMDQLVARTGGSKATLYRYFESKEALFEAIIADVAASTVGGVKADEWTGTSLEDGLRIIGRAVAAGAMAEHTTVLLRLALGEHNRFPQLGRTLFEHGPAVSYERLKRFLTTKHQEGVVEFDDLQIAAEQFIGGIVGHQQLRLALGVEHASPKDMNRRVEAAIRSFIASYAVG